MGLTSCIRYQGAFIRTSHYLCDNTYKNQHWLLIVIYPKCKVIALFGSVNSTSQTVQEIVKNILILLELYSRCRGLNFELNKWKYVHEFDIPK